jgi:hypothetical protein
MATRESEFPRFPFALCLFRHFPNRLRKSILRSHLPHTNYSSKAVFQVFRDFHSVPVKTQLCSNWNTQAVARLEKVSSIP